MPSYCIICEFRWTKDDSTSFHKFNFDREDISTKWTEFVRKHKNQPNWKPSRWSSICNKHFLPTDFKVQKGLLRKHLKSDAVPTIQVPHTPIDNEKLPPPSAIPVAPTSTLLTLSEAITNVTLPLDRSSIGTQCRLCTQIIYNEGANIFNCRSLQEWTSKHLPRLNILPDDCLPKCICPSCFHQLEQFDRFSETAIQSQNSFCAELAATVPSSTSNSLFRNSFDSPRVIKIKQEPIVSIKEETHLLNTATEQQQQHSEEFETNLSGLLLSDFYQYGLGSGGHIMEITDLTNDFINLTEDDNNVAEGMHQEINIKPNILALRNNSVAGGSGTLHLKQEDGLVIDDFCDEDDLSKAMISNEHSYCKFNLPQFLDGNALRLIKTEKKEEHAAMPTAPPNHTSVAQIPLVTVPKIYIIDNALLKHNCDRCGDMFETRAMLLDHQRRLHHDRFLCGLCKTRFLNFSAFYFHKLNCAYRRGYLTTAGRRKYWQCTQCKMFFRLQLGFKNHVKRQICRKLLRIRSYHQQWSKKIDQVGEMRYTGNRAKTVGAAISKQFACDVCNKTFVRYSNLNQHKLTHSAQRSFSCGLCGKVFKRSCGLTAHHKSFHLKLRPFECSVCHRGFALKADMHRCMHIRGGGTIKSQSEQPPKKTVQRQRRTTSTRGTECH